MNTQKQIQQIECVVPWLSDSANQVILTFLLPVVWQKDDFFSLAKIYTHEAWM